tara:strand:- start:1885 stop:3255 length:1371 start_codon:yes stop_codon:yes gene_type:complete
VASRPRPKKKRTYAQMQTRQQRASAEKSEHRPGAGRERKLQKREALPPILIAALDVLARFRATQEPIQNIINPILKNRRFGNRDRNEIRDWVFQLQRQQSTLEKLLEQQVNAVGGVPPDRRMKDLALLLATMSAEMKATFETKTEDLLPESLLSFVQTARDEIQLEGLPPWLFEKLQNQFGDQAKDIEKAFLQKAVPAFAIDTQQADRQGIMKILEEAAIEVRPFSACPDAFWSAQHLPLSRLPVEVAQHVWPMDLGSQLIAHLVGALPSDQVLDMCAGGGGKTKALARTGCKLVATDVSNKRIIAAQKRSGLQHISFRCLDMTKPQLAEGMFDRILVDAPCTGTGTLRRHPDLLSRLNSEKVTEYVALQKQLLQQAERLVAPNGYVIYATCSFLKEENQDVVSWALENLNLSPVPLNELRPEGVLPEHQLEQHTLNILPHDFLSDGFFVAAFSKQ